MKPRYQREVEKLAKMLDKAIDKQWLAGINVIDVNKTTSVRNAVFHMFYFPTKIFVDKDENDKITIERVRY